jgi:hypothetical protein
MDVHPRLSGKSVKFSSEPDRVLTITPGMGTWENSTEPLLVPTDVQIRDGRKIADATLAEITAMERKIDRMPLKMPVTTSGKSTRVTGQGNLATPLHAPMHKTANNTLYNGRTVEPTCQDKNGASQKQLSTIRGKDISLHPSSKGTNNVPPHYSHPSHSSLSMPKRKALPIQARTLELQLQGTPNMQAVPMSGASRPINTRAESDFTLFLPPGTVTTWDQIDIDRAERRSIRSFSSAVTPKRALASAADLGRAAKDRLVQMRREKFWKTGVSRLTGNQ